jgi:transcriptional regulatory protein RtcR
VNEEIERLKQTWYPSDEHAPTTLLHKFFTKDKIDKLDKFDANQLSYVLDICQRHNSMTSAGKELFNVSRTLKTQSNDSSRLQKYLNKFGLNWSEISEKNE